MGKRPGWYYTQDGRLRYHDERGWTEYYLSFDEIRNIDGQPPPPMTMLDQVRARQSEESALRPRRQAWWRRQSRSR